MSPARLPFLSIRLLLSLGVVVLVYAVVAESIPFVPVAPIFCLLAASLLLLVLQLPYFRALKATIEKGTTELERLSKVHQQVMECSPDIICVADDAGRFKEVSVASTRIWRYSPEELIGRRFIEFVHPDDRERTNEIAATIARGIEARDFLNRYIRKDGTVVDIAWSARWSEEHREIYAIARDVTEDKSTRARLLETERKHASLLSNLPGMAYRCANNPTWTMEVLSDGCLTLTGYTAEEFTSEAIFYGDLIHLDDRDLVWRKVQEGIEKGSPFELKYRINSKHQGQRWVWEQGHAVFDGENFVALEGYVTDVTEKVEAEHTSRLREEFNRAVMDSLTSSTAVIDLSGTIVTVNEAWREFARANQGDDHSEQGVGRNYLQICDKAAADGAPYAAETAAGLRSILRGEAEQFDIIYPCDAPFEKRWFLLRAVPMNGGAVISHLNITALKEAEERVREHAEIIAASEERFRAAFDGAPIGIALVALDGKWLRVNAALSEITGYSSEELLALNFQTLTHQDDLPKDIALAQQLLDGKEKSYQIDKRYFRKDGALVWVQLHGSLVRSQAGEPLYFVAHIEDITEKKLKDEELRQNKERLDIALQAGGLGIWDWHVQTGEVHYDAGWMGMLGYAPDELAQTLESFAELMHSEDLVELSPVLNDFIAGRNDEYRPEFRLRAKDGTWRWILSQGKVTERGTQGEALRATGVHMDVTAKREAGDILVKSKESAEEANRLKSEFLANMSHEIRTPITSILGFAEALVEEKMDKDEQSTALKTILGSGNHLLSIINDILDVSKIEAGRLEIENIPCELFRLLRDVEELLRSRAVEKGIAFTTEYVFPLPPIITTDPVRFKQILINIAGNAIKFTEAGGVTVKIGYEQAQQKLSVAVIDTGIGIEEGQEQRMFHAFRQADASTTRKFGGSGLGLSISKELATRLGGTITVESTVGRGSTFVVTLSTGPTSERGLVNAIPPHITVSKNTGVSAPVSAITGKILVAEDGVDNQRYLSFLLQRAGAHFTIVENGAKALEEMQRDRYDLILLDMQMPVMDGYTAARLLREIDKAIPIIALTANAMKSDVDRCMSLGCTDFIGKPFKRDFFYSTIARHLIGADTEGGETDHAVNNVTDLLDECPELLVLVHQFLENLPTRVTNMSTALAADDLVAVSMQSHQLKGAAGTYGFSELYRVCGILEKAAAGGEKSKTITLLDELARCARSACNSTRLVN